MRVELNRGGPEKFTRGTFLVYGGLGSGKCVTGDTRILSPDGRYERIDDIVRWGKYQVLSLNTNTNELVPVEPSHYYDLGYSRVFRVQLTDGRVLEGTPEHPVLTLENGYVPLSKLVEGDDVLVVDDLPYFGNEVPRKWEPELLAYLIADGNLTQGSPTISKKSEMVRGRIKELVASTGDDFKERFDVGKAPRLDISGGHIKGWLGDIGLLGKKSRGKFVPSYVFSWNKDSIKLFLSVLFFCDGHATITPRPGRPETSKTVEIGYSSASIRLIHDVSHLLRRFGIRSRSRYVKGMLNGKEHGAYTLSVGGNVQKLKFLEEISIDRRNIETIKSYLNRSIETFVREDSRDLGNGIRVEKVKSVEFIGEKKVYDLTVPDHHNFLANDFISHNTRFASTFPRPLFLSEQTEEGWTTIEGMNPELFWESRFTPVVEAISSAEEMVALIKKYTPSIQKREFKTLVVDSLTFYGESYLDKLSRAAAYKDGRQLYQAFYGHIYFLMVEIHKLPCNVVWLCGLREPEKPGMDGGPALPGKAGRIAPSACSYLLHAKTVERDPDEGEVWEMHTKRCGWFPARQRGAPKDIQSPLEEISFRGFLGAMKKEYID